MPEPEDIRRLRSEYNQRSQRYTGSDIYSHFNPANLFTMQQRERALLMLLRRYGFKTLKGLSILEMGCGSGGVLTEYLRYGSRSADLVGVDLLHDRLAQAHVHLPAVLFANCDGQHLPFKDSHFDLVMQYTAFSSLLDFTLKKNIAIEMQRVLKPDGSIIWYDFWLNPLNRHTNGIRPAEVRTLFAGCQVDFQKTTLAPPITRRVAPWSWGIALFLESLQIFNTHYLAIVRPQSKDA